MTHILPTSANETISEDIGDNCPVFFNAFPWSARSAETLQNALSTQTKRDDLLFMSVIDPLFSFLLLLLSWLEAGGYFSLDNFSILCS